MDRAVAERTGAGGRDRPGALSRRARQGRAAARLVGVAVLMAAAPPLLAQQEVVVPAGTALPIRFLRGLVGGRDRPGEPVVAQTLAALAVDSCVVVPPFVPVIGTLARSRAPGRGGRPGALEIHFSALDPGRGERLAVEGVLDSLEYSLPSEVLDSGLVLGGRRARAGRAVVPIAVTAVAAASEVLAVPVALLSGFELLHRGERARIIAGEVGRLRLLAPLVLQRACSPVASHRSLTEIPALPRFTPLAANRTGRRAGDPINLVFLGTGPALDAAFEAAGWQVAGRGTAKALAREITAILLGHSSYEAPVSTEYFEGRRQDVAWQLPGPSARIRHHLRIWLLDSTTGVWVGSAIKDVGLLVRPLTGTATHRVDPDADAERDFIVTSLEASGCAHLVDYLALPGAVRSGRDISRQPFFTDGRAAVVRVGRCEPPTDPGPDAQAPRGTRSRGAS